MSDTIFIRTDESSLEIPIYDKISVITGDSSTGKTKMMQFLKACKNAWRNNVKIESNINLKDIILVDNEYTLESVIIRKESGKFIFIDRFNILVNNDILNFMKDSKNIFVIIGHRNISELTSQDAVLRMKCDGNNYICEQIYKHGILYPLEAL